MSRGKSWSWAVPVALTWAVCLGASGPGQPGAPGKVTTRDNFGPTPGVLKRLSPEELDEATKEFFEGEKVSAEKAVSRAKAVPSPAGGKPPPALRLSRDVVLEG